MTESYDIPTYAALILMQEDSGLTVSLHETDADAFDELREILNSAEVDYQEPLPLDATRDQIEDAANERSQFYWEVQEVRAP